MNYLLAASIIIIPIIIAGYLDVKRNRKINKDL